jgi:putative ABC transport system ATP-binding protein
VTVSQTKFSVKEKKQSMTSVTGVVKDEEVFHLTNVNKRWPGVQGFTLAVPELIVRQGEKVALVGMSGCGKSTLLDLLAMVLRPDEAGQFDFFSQQGQKQDIMEAWTRKKLSRLARIRMEHIGYILQTGGLFPFLSIRENIGISLMGLGLPVNDAVEDMAKRLHIERHLNKYPGQLSVGERQRVAIGRAMAHRPSLVIADEPTASLDPINAEDIMDLFSALADEKGVTLIMATHDWGNLGKRGFRHVQFDLKQEADHGAVKAKVFG